MTTKQSTDKLDAISPAERGVLAGMIAHQVSLLGTLAEVLRKDDSSARYTPAQAASLLDAAIKELTDVRYTISD